MRRALHMTIAAAIMAVVLAPAQARAEGFFAPWAGVNFANEPADGRAAFGISAGGMGAGVIGGEFDFGYAPGFVGDSDLFGSNSLLTVMGNLIVGIPIGGTRGGGVRPYVTGGVGLIRTQIDGGTLVDIEDSDNNFGFNVGAGLMGFFSDHFGVRGDLRYFRDITRTADEDDDDDIGGLDLAFGPGNFDFWRLSFGIVIR